MRLCSRTVLLLLISEHRFGVVTMVDSHESTNQGSRCKHLSTLMSFTCPSVSEPCHPPCPWPMIYLSVAVLATSAPVAAALLEGYDMQASCQWLQEGLLLCNCRMTMQKQPTAALARMQGAGKQQFLVMSDDSSCSPTESPDPMGNPAIPCFSSVWASEPCVH